MGGLEKEHITKHPKSRQIYERALRCYASIVTHDGRLARLFPIYATTVEGTKKWDVNRNEYVAYVLGHGALLFGYGNKRVLAAKQEQIPKAMQMGACKELEIFRSRSILTLYEWDEE